MTASASLEQVNTIATHTALSAWAFGSDFLVLIVLVAALFFFAWYMGRGPFIALLVSFYVGYALYALFPFAKLLPQTPAATALASAVALYAALVFLSYLILRRVASSDFVSISPFALAALALLGASFLIALAYHVFPDVSIYGFPSSMNTIFEPREYFFWWFAAPLVGLFFLAR